MSIFNVYYSTQEKLHTKSYTISYTLIQNNQKTEYLSLFSTSDQ